MLKSVIALIVIGFVTFPALAETTVSDWRHAALKSAEGAEITIDYQIVHDTNMSNKPSESYTLSPVIVNFTRSGLTPRDKVQVVVVNEMKNLGSCGSRAYDWQESTYVDLVAAPEGHFYGDLTEQGFRRETFGIRYNQPVRSLALVMNPYCQTQVSYGQSIAVVVNGHWLVDPISHTTNFRLDLGHEIAARYRH